jgi:oligopeptide transport system substrate-binding protein
VGDYVDPNTFLDLFTTNGGTNQTGWSNTVYDRLLASAANVEQFVAAPDFILQHAHRPEELKRLADSVRTTTDASARLKSMTELRFDLLSEAERILIHDDYPVLPVYIYMTGDLVKPKVKGFYMQLVTGDGAPGINLRDIHPLRALSVNDGAPSTADGRLSQNGHETQ